MNRGELQLSNDNENKKGEKNFYLRWISPVNFGSVFLEITFLEKCTFLNGLSYIIDIIIIIYYLFSIMIVEYYIIIWTIIII